MPGIDVSVDNFVRAETDRMFTDLCRDAGGANRFHHNRTVSWQMSIPRSASRSSTFRSDSG